LQRFEETHWFEACLPIEELARRGVDTLRFGPMNLSGCAIRVPVASHMRRTTPPGKFNGRRVQPRGVPESFYVTANKRE